MNMLVLVLFVLFSVLLFMLPQVFEESSEKVAYVAKLLIPKNGNFLELRHVVSRNVCYGLNEFRTLMRKDFGVWFIWVMGAILWVSGFGAWILNAQPSYSILTYLSVLLCAIAILVRSRMIPSDFFSNR